MAEYIERADAAEFFEKNKKVMWHKDDVAATVSSDAIPTADVVEVVRCRYCKYHHWEQEPCHGKTEHFCSVLNAQVFADFYCYHGAKMDGKGDKS